MAPVLGSGLRLDRDRNPGRAIATESISPGPGHRSECLSRQPSTRSGISARCTSSSERAPTRLRPASASQWRARTPSTAATTRSSAPGERRAPSFGVAGGAGGSRPAAAIGATGANHPDLPTTEGRDPSAGEPDLACSTFATYAGLRPLRVRSPPATAVICGRICGDLRSEFAPIPPAYGRFRVSGQMGRVATAGIEPASARLSSATPCRSR